MNNPKQIVSKVRKGNRIVEILKQEVWFYYIDPLFDNHSGYFVTKERAEKSALELIS